MNNPFIPAIFWFKLAAGGTIGIPTNQITAIRFHKDNPGEADVFVDGETMFQVIATQKEIEKTYKCEG